MADASPHPDTSRSRPSIDLGGERWAISEYGGATEAEVPTYTCISYAWGASRAPNPFGGGRKIAARTIPVLTAAITCMRPAAVWIDALCVPEREPAREACLRSMGAIYGAAEHVVVVLPPAASKVLDAMRAGDPIIDDLLRVLEVDEWVTRAWTYQELANGRECSFITQDGGVPLASSRFLNAVGGELSRFKRDRGMHEFEFRSSRPRLDALESLTADWMLAMMCQRSAYQVMSGMHGRSALNPDDRYYAMIGALTKAPAVVDDLMVPASEYFMRVCERKGDFSFLYATHSDGDQTTTWRPAPGSLAPVFPWFTDGEGQSGELRPASLRLHGIHRTRAGELDSAARAWLESTRNTLGLGLESPITGDTIADRLRRGGFGGTGQPIECTDGFYLPYRQGHHPHDAETAVSTEIRWRFGAPALLLHPASSPARVIDVGVFVGVVPPDGHSIDLA